MSSSNARNERRLEKKDKSKPASAHLVKQLSLQVYQLTQIVEANGFFDAQFGVEFDLEKIPEDLKEKTLRYATHGAAGFDIAANLGDKEVTIHAGETVLIPTGLYLKRLEENYELQIRSRSGNAAKHSVVALNAPGTIDPDYLNKEIKVILINHGKKNFVVKHGDRIAQGVFSRIFRGSQLDGFNYPQEDEAERSGGFGSTGV